MKFQLKPAALALALMTLGAEVATVLAQQLPPFQIYVRNQPTRFGPRMLEDEWAAPATSPWANISR